MDDNSDFISIMNFILMASLRNRYHCLIVECRDINTFFMNVNKHNHILGV